MIRLARILTCTVALLLASCGVVGAQTNGQSGPYSSQIQVALWHFLTITLGAMLSIIPPARTTSNAPSAAMRSACSTS